MVFIGHVKVAQDIGAFRIRGGNFRAAMKQAAGLIKINRMGNVRGNADISLARLANTVHLDGEQHRDMLPLQRARQRTVSVPPQLWPKMMILACSLSSAVSTPSRLVSSRLEDVAESLLSGVIAKHLHVDSRGITVAQTRGKLHFGMLRIVVPDEAANEPDNDHFVRGESTAGRGIAWPRAELNDARLAAAKRNNRGKASHTGGSTHRLPT